MERFQPHGETLGLCEYQYMVFVSGVISKAVFISNHQQDFISAGDDEETVVNFEVVDHLQEKFGTAVSSI